MEWEEAGMDDDLNGNIQGKGMKNQLTEGVGL